VATTLGIWAHPDDEVFVAGGLLADAARRGERVVCLHMTSGEAGLSNGRRTSPLTLATIRRHELDASLACLGVEEQHYFDYSDGCLPLTSRGSAIERLHEVMDEVQPDTIVTFGADGFTGHPDHRVLSSWVTGALWFWNQPDARLCHATMTQEWKDSFVPALNEFDAFWPGYPQACSLPDLVLELDEDLLGAKVEALRAHSSQMAPFFDAYGDNFMRAMASTECFRVSRTRLADLQPTAGTVAAG
jgi:LmbE family N-acetylglucosaminyl deacetylase